jgi:hypothetical protein
MKRLIVAFVLACAANAASSVPVAAQLPPPDPIIMEKIEIPVHNTSDSWVFMTADRWNPIGSDTNIAYWCVAPGENMTKKFVINVKDNVRWLRFQVSKKDCARPVVWDHKFERESWMRYTISGKDGSYAVTKVHK